MKNTILGSLLLCFLLAIASCNNNQHGNDDGSGKKCDSTNTKPCCKKDGEKKCCKSDSSSCQHDSTACAMGADCGKNHGGTCDPEKEGCCKKGEEKACCKKGDAKAACEHKEGEGKHGCK